MYIDKFATLTPQGQIPLFLKYVNGDFQGSRRKSSVIIIGSVECSEIKSPIYK